MNTAKLDDAIATVKPEANLGIKTSEQAYDGKFALSYDNKDSLNPYTLKTKGNSEIITLMYDSLIKLDSKFKPIYCIASDIKLNLLECNITIKENLKFSDGTIVTTKDIISSINAAKENTSRYNSRLKNISSIKKNSEYSLTILLITPDILFTNLLDFPIVKDTTQKADIPIGSGRYVFINDKEKFSLNINSNYTFQTEPKIKKIDLIVFPDKDTLSFGLKLGTVNFVYDESLTNGVSIIGSNSYSIKSNNLCYVGINSNNLYLKDNRFRKAISIFIDRNSISSKAFFGHATISNLPINPDFEIYNNSISKGTLRENEALANSLLNEIGLTKKDADGYRLMGKNRVIISILINSENNQRNIIANSITESLKKIGIEVRIVKEEYNSYKAKISTSNFDMYIAEIKLKNNFDISALITAGQPLAVGVINDANLINKYTQYQRGEIKAQEFIDVFVENPPFIPLCFKNGVAAFTKIPEGDIKPNCSDLFYNIENVK